MAKFKWSDILSDKRVKEYKVTRETYDARTDFKRLKRFLYELVFNDEFRRLPFVTMKEYLIGNFPVFIIYKLNGLIFICRWSYEFKNSFKSKFRYKMPKM